MTELNSLKMDDTENEALTKPHGDFIIRRNSKSSPVFIGLLVIISLLVVLLLITSVYAILYFQKETSSVCGHNSSLEASSHNESNYTNDSVADLERSASFLSQNIDDRVKDVRLPFNVIPILYTLTLQANIYDENPMNFNFNGSVLIQIFCSNETDFFFIHAHEELKVNTSLIRIYSITDQTNLLDAVVFDKRRQWLRLELIEQLEVGSTYFLEIPEFHGALTMNLKGWYLSAYKENREKKYLATSQLQPTDARRVFPCWDEPAFKAQFQINLWRKNDYTTLSNMPLLRTKQERDNWVTDVYEPTLNTSTYLLAFVVCQFKSLPSLDSRNRNFTIWARPDLIEAGWYAQKIGKQIIGFFEEYFELEYPLNKTDMLAVPNFAAGAMENWGLMIYREATLIWDPVSGTESARQKVATVISHEIAHQWFGNLVTLKWWDDLWLNEGFATFVEYIGVAHAEPTWNMDEQFVVLQLQKVFQTDSLATTHPVFMPVYHPDEINEIFDTISYNKGASILRMAEAFLGTDTFRRGLRIYLSRYKFNNTESKHLWEALTEASKDAGKTIDVRTIMNSWIMQSGYPLVTVRRVDNDTLHLTQKRFTMNVDAKINSTPDPDNTTWHIPLTYSSESENIELMENRTIWMNNASITIKLDNPGDTWCIFNLRQTGFYRVNYDENTWNTFISQLKSNHAAIPRITRAQMIDDSFNIANHGTISFNLFMVLTEYLQHEREFVPLNAAYRAFSYLLDMLLFHDSHESLKAYVRQLINDAYLNLTWDTSKDEDKHLASLARQTIVTLACESDHEGCINKSKNLFAEFMKNQSSNLIPTSLQRTVFCSAIRSGGAKEWDFLHKLRQTILHEDAKYRILEALGCTRDFVKMQNFINELTTDAKLKYDEIELPASLNNNPIGLYLLWDMVRKEWNNRSASIALPMILKAVDKRRIIIESLPVINQLRDMYTSAKNDSDQQISRSIARILLQANHNKLWLNRCRDVIYNWLKTKINAS